MLVTAMFVRWVTRRTSAKMRSSARVFAYERAAAGESLSVARRASPSPARRNRRYLAARWVAAAKDLSFP